MKKAALLTGLLLILFVFGASAAGINMYWTDCGPAGVTNRVWSCMGCSGNHDIFMSFDPPQPIQQLTGNSQIVDVQAASATLPDWWQFKNPGSCRQFSVSAPSLGPGSCADTWAGQETGSIDAYLVTANTPSMPVNRARLLSSVAVPGDAAAVVVPGTEYYSMAIRINIAKTVGTGACSGCTTPVCLVLAGITLTDINGSTSSINFPLNSHFITWQGGAVGGGCPGATPALNQTWGRVKSIYR